MQLHHRANEGGEAFILTVFILLIDSFILQCIQATRKQHTVNRKIYNDDDEIIDDGDGNGHDEGDDHDEEDDDDQFSPPLFPPKSRAGVPSR